MGIVCFTTSRHVREYKQLRIFFSAASVSVWR